MDALIEGAAPALQAQVQRVSSLRPFVWLNRGLADFNRCRRQDVAQFALRVVLAGFAAGRFVVSGVFLSAVLNVSPPDFLEASYRGFPDLTTRAQLVSCVGVGAVLALLVFVLSVVTVPAITDAHATAEQAMVLSIDAVRASHVAMVLWSVVLVGLTAIGFATLLFGMIFVIPLPGRTTWHAYRDLVRV